jgi:hypothetical protein
VRLTLSQTLKSQDISVIPREFVKLRTAFLNFPNKFGGSCRYASCTLAGDGEEKNMGTPQIKETLLSALLSVLSIAIFSYVSKGVADATPNRRLD